MYKRKYKQEPREPERWVSEEELEAPKVHGLVTDDESETTEERLGGKRVKVYMITDDESETSSSPPSPSRGQWPLFPSFKFSKPPSNKGHVEPSLYVEAREMMDEILPPGTPLWLIEQDYKIKTTAFNVLHNKVEALVFSRYRLAPVARFYPDKHYFYFMYHDERIKYHS